MERLLKAINRHLHNDTFTFQEWEEIAQHGADAGWAGFTYYADTEAFYDNNKADIIEYAGQVAEDLGHGNICEFVATFNCGVESAEQYKNALAWFILEETARYVEDLGEDNYSELLGE